MPPLGLAGGFYTSQSVNADCQTCENMFVEAVESGSGKAQKILLDRPGLKEFCDLTGTEVEQTFDINGRVFAVAGVRFVEIFADKTFQDRGTIAADFNPVYLAASTTQVVIASAGHAYLLILATNVLTEILTNGTTALQGPVFTFWYSDGYFIALLKDGRFQISSLLDGATWDPADIAKVSVFPDDPIAMIVDHREIVIAGRKQGQVYFDSGNPLFPFDVVPGGFAENGVGAPASLVKADNTYFWIDQDERGAGIARRAQGYSPVRISTHAIEEKWRKFPTIEDAVGMSFQLAGHTFVAFFFPSGNQFWVFDIATALWAEWTHLIDGKPEAFRAQCHVYAFGKHLVGDWKSGKIYEMSLDFKTDDGTPLRRSRRLPHISKENQRIAHSEVCLDMEVGLGPQPPLLDGEGKPRGPQIMLRWSDDGGHTWSNIHIRDCGQAGQHKKRVRWTRLGMSRDRVYEFSFSDPVPLRLIEAYLNP